MKHGIYGTTYLAFAIALMTAVWCGNLHAQDQPVLTVEYGAVCEDVVNREVVAASTSFPATIEKLYCFTRILGATEPTSVFHVWYHGETERARVELPVKSSSWRTYSSKGILPAETGTWRVEVTDVNGRILETYRFDIYNQQ